MTPVAEPLLERAAPSRFSSQRLWFRGLLIGGLVVGAFAMLGLFGPEVGYLVLDPVTRHVGILLMASLSLLIAAAIVMPPLPAWGNVVRVLVIVGLGLVLAFIALVSALTFLEVESRYASPDGRSILVVRAGSDMIDPVWYVTVQQPSPVLARTWDVACFNGDYPPNELASIRWVSSTLIEAEAGSGQVYQVTVDPSDSQPSSTLVVGCRD